MAPKREKQLEGGQHPALAVKGKAHAAGNVDTLRPGDPGYGTASVPPKRLGLRAESDKLFRLSKDEGAAELVRVYDTDPNNKHEEIVLFSGSRKHAERVYDALEKFLKK